MSDYHLVSTFHAVRVTLADARKAGDAAAVAAAEAQVAAARAAVAAALADGRVASAAHLLDLDLDSLGAILSHLGPRDALSTSHACATLRSALFRSGLPGLLAGVCYKLWQHQDTAAKEAALRALDGMEPALGALRLDFRFKTRFNEGHARMLARALDAAPRATRIDIKLSSIYFTPNDGAGRLAAILSSTERTFPSTPQVHMELCNVYHADILRRLTRAGVCVASIEQGSFLGFQNFIERVVAPAGNTLTQLKLRPPMIDGSLDLTARFPALRRLILSLNLMRLTTNMSSLMTVAPLLKEIEFCSDHESFHHHPPKLGFGFEPRQIARFVAAIQGVTRVRFGLSEGVTLMQNENENLRHLMALRTLRDLEVSCKRIWVDLGTPAFDHGPPSTAVSIDKLHIRAPVAEDAITNLLPLPLGLTRLAFSRATRVAFGHPFPELRVMEWRGSWKEVHCLSFYRREFHNGKRVVVERRLRLLLAIPSAAIAPKLCTLLVGYDDSTEGLADFDLWTLVAARTALRVVVIEHARLLCSAPAGFDTSTAGFAAVLAREAKDLVSVHTHGCEIEGGREQAVENFLRAVEERGGRVCGAGLGECLFGMLHDGTDLWER